jgi:conjugal transfer mating pair stabilization protein TraN
MMKKTLLGLSLFLTSNLFAVSSCSFADEILTHNGHYYGITGNTMEFDEAQAFAEQYGGYLAVPNTTAENTFLKELTGGGDGAWIGIKDFSMSSNYCYTSNSCSTPNRFTSIKGQALTYTNWDSYQPDNFVQPYDVVDGKQMVSPLGEHWTVLNGNNGKWYDTGNHMNNTNNPAKFRALLEFDTKPTCYQTESTVTDNWTTKMCNTQIYDATTGNVDVGTTLSCQKDNYGTDYCPSALATASTTWDYNSGYSTYGVGTVVDYANKVSTYTTALSILQNRFYGSRISYYNRGTPYLYSGDYGNQLYMINTFDTGWVNLSNNSSGIYQTNTFGVYHSNGATDDSAGYITSTLTNYYEYRVSNGVLQNRFYGQRAKDYRGNYYYDVGYTAHLANCGNCQRTVYLAIGTTTIEYFDTGWQTVSSITGARANVISKTETPDDSSYTAYYFNYNDYKLSQYCSDGSTPINGQCVTTTCPSGYTDNGSNCKKTIEYTYYNYLCYNNANSQGYNYAPTTSGGNCNKTDTNTTSVNSSTLDDACNSSTPPTNNCARQEFKCQYNDARPPVWVDNKWQCSPFPCYGEESVEVAGTIEGSNDTNNDGWNENGACNGQIYIFNGKDHRCRDSDVFFGLTGGGCCDKDKVFAGLIQCKENEKILAKKNKAEFCHYVGTYCSKYLKLGFAKICIQKSKSHCCFSSKIARAIQEQGRPQLSIDWGSGDSPQCRGFTPEEFQKLDFSKIDLSNEFDIPTLNQSELSNTLSTAVSNLQNMLNSN